MIPPLLSYANVKHLLLHTYVHIQKAYTYIQTYSHNMHIKRHKAQLYGTQQSGSFILKILKI